MLDMEQKAVKNDTNFLMALFGLSALGLNFSKESVKELFKANDVKLDEQLYDHYCSERYFNYVVQAITRTPDVASAPVVAASAPVVVQKPVETTVDFSSFF